MAKLVFLVLVFIGLGIASKSQTTDRGVPISFTLKEPGYVTLVIEDKNGQRVRNLVSDNWYKAGKNVLLWDGLDDLGRDFEASHHGIYNVPGHIVPAGSYTVRGIVHPEIRMLYEFSIYNAGKTAWNTKDNTGGWLADHSPPQAAAFVPAALSPTKQPVVFLGSYVSEARDGIIWVDLDGNKLGGKRWIGGAWTAAPYLACDAGDNATPGVAIYAASAWETTKGSGELELRISSVIKPSKPIITYDLGTLGLNNNKKGALTGLAVNNAIGVASLMNKNQLLFIDLKAKAVIGTKIVRKPFGSVFDLKGRLFVLSDKKLIRFDSVVDPLNLPNAQTIISTGLDSPVAVAIDRRGNLYISDAGATNQIKVFSGSGKLLRTIGVAGPSKAGAYDPLHMNNPAGIAIDEKEQLWVTENDFLPKRVSVWSLDGRLIKAFYGPPKYGGGGALDQQDKNAFYYSEGATGATGAMKFKIDWKKGTSTLEQIIYRESDGTLKLPKRNAGPETPLYYKGIRYFTNSFNSYPTGGLNASVLFIERGGIAYPAAAMGDAAAWSILKIPPNGKTFFIWIDLNGDANVQNNEVVFQKAATSGITVMPDLSFCVANYDGNAMKFSPVSFTDKGIPVYQLSKGIVLATGVKTPGSTGGNQVLSATDGWTVLTQGLKPFEKYSLSGAKDGKPMWSYPNMWPGLHASHSAPNPSFPGELIGPTRVLGNFLEMKGEQAGRLWAINSNHGMVYIFTGDGLFVCTLFEPMRSGKLWNMVTAKRGMDLKGITLNEENFWPSISRTPDGMVYLLDGNSSSLVKIDGLQRIIRLPSSTISISSKDLQKINSLNIETETHRQKEKKESVLNVLNMPAPPTIDGKLDDWNNADWVEIDKRGVKSYLNARTKPYDVTGAVAVSKSRLYFAYRTGDSGLLKNSGALPDALFKTGGALDIMIGADPGANPTRKDPVLGDLRLLITTVNRKPKALLYKAVSHSTKEKIPFSSPWRTITFDEIADITGDLEFAGNDGNYELSVPLSLLGIKPIPNVSIKGDIGILRGDGTQTISRIYWSNKATSILSDVPSEAQLTPNLWGTWLFK